jgi:hemerythrin
MSEQSPDRSAPGRDDEPGIPEIDAQHAQIGARIADLEASLAQHRLRAAHGALHALARYLIHHFDTEERLMERAGYPFGREHAREHAAEVERIAAAAATRDALDAAALRALVADLKRWLDDHVREQDGALSRFETARTRLQRPAENQPVVDPAPAPERSR